MRKLTFLQLLIFSACVRSWGQSQIHKTTTVTTVQLETPSMKVADYSAEPIVIEKLEHIYTMAADGTGSELTTVVARVQSDALVRQFGVVNLPFAGSSQRVEIAYVRVRKADGSVTETPASQAIEMPSPVTTAAPFYSDLKQMQIPVRNLRVGDRLEWQAKVVRTKAEAPGQFWGLESFQQGTVTISEVLELHVPKDLPVTVWSPEHKATENTAGGEKVYHWESSQLKPTVGKEAEAEKERKKKEVLTPQQELEEKEGKLPDVAWTTFKSWEEVGAWYRGLEADRMLPDAEVKAKVTELVVGKTTDEAKARAVYAYVSSQLRYIGIAFGIGRYQPHTAVEVLQNQYGDCKDKHTLLAAMLAAVGLHPDAVLIGAGVRFNEAVPSPASFNHLITEVKIDGQPVWLDATAEVAPYRALMYPIRGKKALVIPENGSARVERTPEKLPYPVFDAMDARGTLDKDGISQSRLTLTMRGDDELVMREAFHETSAAQYGELVQRIANGMGYAGTTSNAEIGHLDDANEPLTISYDYKRDRAGDWENHRIIPQVAPVSLPMVDEKEPPVQSVRLGVPHVETSKAEMKLPEGWAAILPEAVHAKSQYATYDETYRFEKGTVYTERRIEVLQEWVPQAEWKAYKKWTDQVDLGSEKYISLTGMGTAIVTRTQVPPDIRVQKLKDGTLMPQVTFQPGGESAAKSEASDIRGSGPGGVSTVASSAEAQKKIAAAYEAVQQRNIDSARATLDDAKALNKEQAWLWATYGMLEMQRFQLPAAIEDFQAELRLHPETYAAYPQLAQAQTVMNQHSEARTTVEKWLAAQPDSADPLIMQITMLLNREDFPGAVAAADAGLSRLPEDQRKREALQLLVGRAEVKAGKKAEGAAVLLALLQTTDNAGVMNDAAYELANARQHLPEAEAASRKALEKLETESSGWTLDEDPGLLNGQSSLIAATWDTLGWALFREGKTAEAESFLRAAWRNRQTGETGEHFGEVEAVLGHRDEALHIYELALATFPISDLMGVRLQAGKAQQDIHERINALKKAGAKSSVSDPHDGLIQVRTIQLGAANGVSGAAEYRLLIGRDGVVKAAPVEQKELEGAAERMNGGKFEELFPSDSKVRLARRGVVNCHAAVCELVLEP